MHLRRSFDGRDAEDITEEDQLFFDVNEDGNVNVDDVLPKA